MRKRYTVAMAYLALNPAYRMVEVEEFLDMDLGDAKAELVDGTISMMAGGSERHAAIAANLIAGLMPKLRGSGCRPYGSDMPLRTREHSVRFPDVTVYCGREGTDRLLDNAKVIFEVLSPSTASNDQIAKLAEYLALPPVDAVVFVDPETERVRIVTREDEEARWLPTGSGLRLAGLGVELDHAEIFARD